MNSVISNVLTTAVTVSADETIEHANKVLFFSNIFFIFLDIIIFFMPIYILAKIIIHKKRVNLTLLKTLRYSRLRRSRMLTTLATSIRRLKNRSFSFTSRQNRDIIDS